MLFADQMIMDASPRYTAEGYMVVAPRIARIGIQEYLASEVGLTDRDPGSLVRVYRPEGEVFHEDALKSMAHRPVTLDHPSEFVDAKTWKELTHGISGGEVARDGDFIRVPMTIMDAMAIEQINSGKKELSVGYFSDLDFTAGTTADGQAYDAVQRNIRANHIAVVDRARGGRQLRVIDHNRNHPEEPTMLKKMLIDGINVEVSDTAEEVIKRHLANYDAKAALFKSKEEEMEAEAKKAKEDKAKDAAIIATKDAELTTLKAQLADAALTPAKLDAAVALRQTVVDTARKVLPTVVVDGKTEAEIRKQVVDAKLGTASKDWSADQITASFGTLTAGVVLDGVRQVHLTTVDTSKAQDSYQKYVDGLGTAYLGDKATH